MGSGRARDQKLVQDNVKTLLREKEDRIATLESRLEAYSARASTAQTRLLKTIDVLDALRSQHALEVSAEEQAKMKLTQEVDRWRSVAKRLEIEKDELKDVVEDLIQKGNLKVEFSEQIATAATDGGETEDGYDSDLLAYATSIIARLRTELDFERQSHSRTVEEANTRIEELEAKVAVREAELERCIISHRDQEHQAGEPPDTFTHAFEKRKLGERLPKPKPLSDEECLRFLESNNTRNRSLELEIRQIMEKLEQAKMAASISSSPRKGPQSPVPQNDHKVIPTLPSRTRSASVDPSVLSCPSDAGKTTSTPAPALLSIVQLDNEIRTMSTQMDALVSERTTLIEAAARQRRVADGINMDAFQDVLRVEGECVQLQAEVDDLREQLQYVRSFADGREKALLREIAQLRASSSSSSALRPVQDLHHIFTPRPLEDDIANEESMELASPLMPTIVANLNPFPPSPFDNSEIEADLVSFPFSPKHASESTSHHSPGRQDIGRVQAALDIAQAHLAQKEEALAQLRAEMERFQLEVRTQVRSNGDGDVD